MTTKRITRNALMLAMLCIVGMISLPLGDTIKVSFQLLIVYIICLTAESVIDCLIITSLYLLLGLFLPVYAGFSIGVSPTFGYVISFVLVTPIIYFVNKVPKLNFHFRTSLACYLALIVTYIVGTIFMMIYMKWDLIKTIGVSIIPYLPFDIAKIVIADLIIAMIPNKKNTSNKTINS